jgi:metallo-beta-lactamase class B
MIPTQQSSQDRHFDRLTTDAAVLLVCSLIFWGCASPRQTRDRPFTQTPQAWNVPVKPFRIVGNVYYVGTAGISSYLVATPAGFILIDCGTAETARVILESIRQLGFDPRQVKLLVGLHGHY